MDISFYNPFVTFSFPNDVIKIWRSGLTNIYFLEISSEICSLQLPYTSNNDSYNNNNNIQSWFTPIPTNLVNE